MSARLPDLDLAPYRALLVPLFGTGCALALEHAGDGPARGVDANDQEVVYVDEAHAVTLCKAPAPNSYVLRGPLAADGCDGICLVCSMSGEDEPGQARFAQWTEHYAAVVAVVGRALASADLVAGMSQELAIRYEELNLVYELEDKRTDVQGSERERLLDTLEATRSYLDLDLVALDIPGDRICMGVTAAGAPSADQMAMTRAFCDALQESPETLVLNRDTVVDWCSNEIGADYKVCAAPVSVDGRRSRGVLLFCKRIERPHFTNSDRRMCEVVVAEITKLLQRDRDRLTGAMNRNGFRTSFEAYLENPKEHSASALLVVDVDNLHGLNERVGLAATDTVLRQIAHTLRASNVAAAIPISRIGADQFACVVEATDDAGLVTALEQIAQRLAEMTVLRDGRVIEFTASIGGIVLDQDVADSDTALNLANISLREAKAAGGNCQRLFHCNDTHIGRYREELGIVAEIRSAFEEDRFELHAQAITATGPVPRAEPYFEVLLRLRDHQGELVSPGRFIPVAERHKLMPEIDAWVAEHAIAALGRHLAQGGRPVRLAINLSGQSMSSTDLADTMANWLQRYGVTPELLTVEVTETSAISNMDNGAELLERLRGLGMRIALDDFGSGMSSFGYLRNLPVDVVKIDGSFVRRMAKHHLDHTFVDVINRLAHAMGLLTVAEFVEDEATLALVTACKIDYAQGYLMSRPVALELQLAPFAAVGLPERLASGG